LLWQGSAIDEQQKVHVPELFKCKWSWMSIGHVQVDYEIKCSTCMAPPLDTNLLTRMWCLVTTSQILVSNFLEYVKLVELAMVQVVGSVENEPCFSTWPLWSPSSTIDSPPIFHWLCACLHNISILYRTSLMKNGLSNGDLLDTVILMMAKVQWTSYLRRTKLLQRRKIL
jgi:hypothetical protein